MFAQLSLTMTIPDARAWESPLPAFSTVAEFRACTRLIRAFQDLRGHTIPEAVVPCAVERIGGYRCSGGLTELTDILFGDEDEDIVMANCKRVINRAWSLLED